MEFVHKATVGVSAIKVAMFNYWIIFVYMRYTTLLIQKVILIQREHFIKRHMIDVSIVHMAIL